MVEAAAAGAAVVVATSATVSYKRCAIGIAISTKRTNIPVAVIPTIITIVLPILTPITFPIADKRDRRGNDRDSESSYRTNHDRDRRGGGGAKLCSSRENDKRSGSDDRDRERERDLRDKRDRGADRDRDMYKKDKYAGVYACVYSLYNSIIIPPLLTHYSSPDKRERSDRGERVARYGDWSEHVSSSGKCLSLP